MVLVGLCFGVRQRRPTCFLGVCRSCTGRRSRCVAFVVSCCFARAATVFVDVVVVVVCALSAMFAGGRGSVYSVRDGVGSRLDMPL